MTKLLKITFILTTILFTSCEEKMNEVDFEKSVMTEILPVLIDSVCVDTRLSLNPPPMFGKYTTNLSGHVSIDTTQATEIQRKKLAEWKKGIEILKNDTSKIIIAFDPKILPYKQKYKTVISKNNPNDTSLKLPTDSSKIYVLDLKKIKLHGKFILKNLNEFDKNKIFEREYQFNFSGVFHVTGIKFDKRKETGILDVGFLCGRLCGHGGTVYIKKVKNKWLILKIESTWIS